MVRITETILRDAHQSRLATRMRTRDMLPVAEKLDSVGYHSLEMWGGATFDSCLRYLNEDPWERVRQLKAAVKKTPLQMLLRGQNLLGYKHYPDDVVMTFVERAIGAGIDIIRIFDALNDPRNTEVAIKATRQSGGHAQGCIVYTTSPVHDADHYLAVAREMVEMGADSICIKDMAGLLSPRVATVLINRLKGELGVPLQLHSHCTSGMAPVTYARAVEAGVDVVDTALSALAGGTSQPATETMVAVFQGTEHDTGMDINLLISINEHFRSVRESYRDVRTPVEVDPRILSYQVPGGMLSNLRAQLQSQNMMDRWEEVLAEVPRVREDLGYPPLVTPMSQIVGTQAVLNVVTGQRYSVKSREIKDYVRGNYGRPPGEISDEVKQQVIGDEEVITCRPADLLPPSLDTAREEIGELASCVEDVLSYALFPDVAREYLRGRRK